MMIEAREPNAREARGGLAFGASHKNVNFPDDLMLLILLRCPVKTIFRFQCVSKPWHYNLSCPSFRDAYISLHKELGIPQPLLGFFNFEIDRGYDFPRLSNEEAGPQGFSFLPTDIEGEPLTLLAFVDAIGSFRAISNGLVLCGNHPNFHVFNPITRKLFSLPQASVDIESMNSDGGFVDYQAAPPGFFSTELDNDFQVIVPIVNKKRLFAREVFVKVEMYSSKSGLWKEYNLGAVDRAASFHVHTVVPPTTTNGGTFLWFTNEGGLMVYDPNRAVDHVLLFGLPETGCTLRCPTVSQTSDGFLQCAVDATDLPGFRVFTLANRLDRYGFEAVIHRREWIPTYDVKLDFLDALWPGSFHHAYNRQHERNVARMAFHPFNPCVLIFRMGARIFSCDVENGQVNEVPYGGRHLFASTFFMLLPYVQPHWPPSPLPQDM